MRTNDEMLMAADDLENQANNLPSENYFNESNDEDIQELRDWATDLRAVAEGEYSRQQQVAAWIAGDVSDLDDCL